MTGGPVAQARLDEALNCERQGKLDQAERIYHAILALDPANLVAKGRLAVIAMQRGQPDQSLAWAKAALAIDRGHQPARLSVGIALHALARLHEAKSMLGPLVRDAPDDGPAHYVLGQVLWDLREQAAAAAAFDRALALSPELAANLAAEHIERLNRADWQGYEVSAALIARLVREGRILIDPVKFMHASNSAADHQACARLTAARKYPARPPLWTGRPRREGKIRLGYLASDFYDHAVAHVVVGCLEHHDRDRFELTAFSCCPPYPSPVRDRLTAAFDRFENLVDRDDGAIARLIAEREIDVLVFLSGYAHRGRPQVLAWRPAPVQVNFLGYPGTLGAPWADYTIADRQVIPDGDQGFFDEAIAWLPHAYQPTDDKVPSGSGARTRAQEGLPERAFVFLAYHQASKISPAIFEVWMRILGKTPGSVLWLQTAPDIAQQNLRSEGAARGIDPTRLIFAQPLASRTEHMARLALADLFVDSLPYNAHSTASDALWAGLPVVTCKGNTFPGRVCASLLTAAGLPDLVTSDLAAYESLILALAADPGRLAALRARVGREVPTSPLFQTAAYTRHLEAAFQTMYEHAQTGFPPASFHVEP